MGGFWRRAFDSSLTVGICRNSAVCQLGVRLVRSWSGRSSWIGSRIARRPATRTFPRATVLASSSRVLRPIDRAFATPPAIWADSQFRQWLDRASGPLDPSQQVRVIGVGLMSAVVTHAVLVGWAGLLDRASVIGSLIAFAVGAVLIAASRPIAAAWRDWR